jgi:acyl-coenzyme A synthetase/AMP-(fatty) acid ligase
MVERFAAIARATPGAPVIVDSMGSLSYAAMLDAVAGLSALLRAAPTRSPVGILLDNDRFYVIAVFACLAAGRLSVLLEPASPDARNAGIAAATGVDTVLTKSAIAATIEWPGVTAIVADFICKTAELPTDMLDLDAPAFILSTSGSSGQPKPIVHSQRTLLNWVRMKTDAQHLNERDRVLCLSSMSSLGGIVPLIGYPQIGASQQMLDLKRVGLSGLIATLKAEPITIIRAAPSLMRSLAALPDAAAIMANLRGVQTYGEPLMKTDVAALRRVLPPACTVGNFYGSTESSGLMWFASLDDDYDPARVPAGVLMPNTEAAIIAEDGTDCARGETGELVIRSRYNALGEWQNGAFVPGRLLPDPNAPDMRIFRTGDIATCSEDGVFVVLGRKDRMIKINGQRVEPGEVEHVLEKLDAVARAEVVVIKKDTGNSMVAFVIPVSDSVADLPALCRAAIRAALPAYMVPSRILPIDVIPTLPSGKTDIQALSALAGQSR